MKNFKLTFIGNPTTVLPIGMYPDKDVNKTILQDTTQIFERYCKSQVKSVDIRSKVVGKEGNYEIHEIHERENNRTTNGHEWTRISFFKGGGRRG